MIFIFTYPQAHLLKDIINGLKMIVLSGKARNDMIFSRIRYFLGGTLLGAVSAFTFYVSAIYNAAIATSNTEIIVNSVISKFDDKYSSIILT